MTWCVVKADQVIQIVHSPRSVTIDDVVHPAAIFRSWSASELKAIGVYPYSETRIDERFHKYSNFSYTIGSDAVTGAWKTKTAKSMDDVTTDGITTLGLKSLWITSTKNTAKSLLSQTDWYVIRLAEKTTALSSKVSTYRDKVRAACDKIEAAINACSDVAALEAMFVVPVDSDGKATGNAPMHDWPDDE
jgi:capsule polysaccharide export protein KpsE/RkpR